MSGRFRVAAAVAALLISGTACGRDEPAASCVVGDFEPLVTDIESALAATDAHYGSPQEYFEVSADLIGVGVIVAVDDATAAEQGFYEGGLLDEPVAVGEASGATFMADAVAFDECTIFDRLREELDDPVIADFAVQGGPDGSVIYDATVQSDSGGSILVLLGPDGEILGAQAVD